MKKFFFLLCLLISSLNTPGMDIKDYRYFAAGKNLSLKNNYSDAEAQFGILVANYPESLLFKSNYANFYIGMNYYNLKNYEKSRNFLERAVYIPQNYNSLKKHYFEYERTFYLGKIYLIQDEKEEALKHFKFLIKNFYSPELEPYEKKALKEIALFDPYYDLIYKVKYEEDLSLLSSLKEEDLRIVGNFFFSKEKYLESEKAYSFYLISKNSKNIKLAILDSLIGSERYQDALERSLEFYQSDNDPDFYYYAGRSSLKTGKIEQSISYFQKVEEGMFKDIALADLGRIFYLKGDYKKAISILKKSSDFSSYSLLLQSYLKIGDKKEFEKAALNFIEKYPESDLAPYYRFILYRQKEDSHYLEWITKHNMNTFYYQTAYSIAEKLKNLKEYPLQYRMEKYSDLLNRVTQLPLLEDSEVIKIEFENLNFDEDDDILKGYLVTNTYERGGFYGEALSNSLKYKKEFSAYSNLIPLLYPKYYDFLVKKSAKDQGLQEELIFSIILQESRFSKNSVYNMKKYGLMQIDLQTAKELSPSVTAEDLLIPRINIDLGARHLKSLLNRYNGDMTKAITAYNAGIENLENWPAYEKGRLDIEKIPLSEAQNYVKNVLHNYYSYKKIYQ